MHKLDLQSIAETHEKPFLILDGSSCIVAANRAFLQAYNKDLAEVLGKPCYQVTHGNARPCHETGEECPYQRVRETGEPHTCLHIHAHVDGSRRIHHVRVKGFPMYLENGELFFGELMEEIAVRDEADEQPHCMAGSSKVFLASLEAMQRAATSDAPVLVQGETGTGKELAATFIHQHSPRSQGPFFTLDCTVLTESLVESELFGHERGAFTGSVGDRQGLFKLADGGTLFLDEIGEMPKQLQIKLLRVLESGEFRRVGGNRPFRTDVRIICATNRDLADEVRKGGFRADLYYRLACLAVNLPSLRERLADIPEIAQILLQRMRRSGQGCVRLTPGGVAALRQYDFPGNVRELRNILQAAAIQAEGGIIDRRLIEDTLSSRTSASTRSEQPRSLPAESLPAIDRQTAPRDGVSLQDLERTHLSQLLQRCAGDRPAVAEALGVSLRTVYRKLKRYGLK